MVVNSMMYYVKHQYRFFYIGLFVAQTLCYDASNVSGTVPPTALEHWSHHAINEIVSRNSGRLQGPLSQIWVFPKKFE